MGIKQKLYNWAMKSPLRKWALNLTGWKWWVWQLVVGGVFISMIGVNLNLARSLDKMNDLSHKVK